MLRREMYMWYYLTCRNECEVMESLLQADIAMSRWSYTNSLLHLQRAHNKINYLLTTVSSLTSRHSIVKLSFLGYKPLSTPVFYNWLKQYKNAIHSKVCTLFLCLWYVWVFYVWGMSVFSMSKVCRQQSPWCLCYVLRSV